MAETKQTKFTAKKIFLLAAAVLLFSAVISVVLTASYGNSRTSYFFRYALTTPRGTVEQGVPPIEGIDPLDEIPAGEIRYNINKNVFFPNGYAQGDILLHNPQSSAYALQFSVYLGDGTSNIPVYTSPILKPGEYISGDKLNRYLYVGVYDCTYSVAAFDPRDVETQTGSASGFLTINVVS